MLERTGADVPYFFETFRWKSTNPWHCVVQSSLRAFSAPLGPCNVIFCIGWGFDGKFKLSASFFKILKYQLWWPVSKVELYVIFREYMLAKLMSITANTLHSINQKEILHKQNYWSKKSLEWRVYLPFIFSIIVLYICQWSRFHNDIKNYFVYK